MTVWFNLVFDTAPVLGKLMPSLMVLVSFLDSPLCRGCFFSVAILLGVFSAPTHGTLLLRTTLLVVMITDQCT